MTFEYTCSPSSSTGSQHDEPFLLELLDLPFPQPIPNLLQQACAARDNEPFQAYSEKTQAGFHMLLCFLFEQYTSALMKLEDKSQSYSGALHIATFFGGLLLLIANSTAIKQHFEAIQGSLLDLCCDKTGDIALEELTNEDEDGDEDGDLHSIQQESIHAACLLKVYHDWFMLMVSHFDAVRTLAEYIMDQSFPYNEVAIRILTPPCVCTQMLSWEALLESPHFPDHESYAKPYNSTRDITQFLHNWSIPQSSRFPIEDLLKAAKPLEDHASNADSTDIIQSLITQLEHHKTKEIPLWSSYIDATISKLWHLHECPPSVWRNGLREIILMIKTLRDDLLFFKKLKQEPLSTGKSFNGTCHCELILASLISLAQTSSPSDPKYAKYRITLDALEVNHILLYSLVLFNLLYYRMFLQLLEYLRDAAQCAHFCSMPYRHRAGSPFI